MKSKRGFDAFCLLAMLAIASCTTPNTDATSTRHAPAATIDYADDGLPYMIRGDLGHAAAPIVRIDDVAPALAAALPPIVVTFGVRIDDLVPTRVQHDELGMTHVRFAQRKNGLPVIGGDFVVHIDVDRVIVSVNGSARDGGALPVVPTITAAEARELARGATGGHVDALESELVYVIATRDGAMHLAWQIHVVGRQLLDDLVYVDATSGAVVDRRPQVFTARNREIRDGNNCSYPFSCGSTTLVGTETSPPTGDDIALAAFTNTGLTYDCYSTLFGRDSYDNAGGKLKSIVHVQFFGPMGNTGNNAAWTGSQMVYGDGDGSMMAPLARSLDVTAHELTHGVTAATANLAYQNEPGALNEGMSDIMGAVCEAWHDGAVSADTWLVGEDIFTPNMAGDALRYMANPTADASLYPPELGGSRDFYSERYQGNQDNGGVHLNSGIPNLAFQLLVAGGKHPRNKTTFMVPGIGIQKAGAIFQRALTQGYFTSNANFAQARTQLEMVAGQLYPGSTATAVGLAWAAVGVGTPPPDADTTPPTVSIVSPADGATVNPAFVVVVQASDNVGVESVEIAVDGTLAGSDTAAPYEFVTPSTLPPGSHTVTATAHDAFNDASASITVTIASATCTSDGDCDSGEVCNDGVCAPASGMNDGDGGGCGCTAGADRGFATGNLMLLVGTLLLVARRRRV